VAGRCSRWGGGVVVAGSVKRCTQAGYVFMPVVVLLSSGSSLPGPRPQLVRVLLPPARRDVVPFPFSPGASRGDEEEKTPMGLVAWGPQFACLAPF
jgi:hypothetical protein